SVRLDTHARRFVQAVPDAELIVLPGSGHLVQNAATDRIVVAIEAMMRRPAIEVSAPAAP
ncbi:MAG TPA: hypothetical protein VHG31_00760, partial [Stellaceae bacterium]|nr:hypothetical protein [Stellaceae bacterium]